MPLPSIQSNELMLATLGKRPFKDAGWILELKHSDYSRRDALGCGQG